MGKRFLYTLLGCALSIGFVALLGLPWWYHYHVAMRPKLNPSPKRFLTVTGHIAKPLSGSLSLTYFTTNPTCKWTANWIEGAKFDREKTFVYPIKPDAQGNYQVKMPLDALQPTRCGWRASSVNYHLRAKYKQQVFKAGSWAFLVGGGKQKLPKQKLSDWVRIKCYFDYFDGEYLQCDPNGTNFNTVLPAQKKDVELNLTFVKHVEKRKWP